MSSGTETLAASASQSGARKLIAYPSQAQTYRSGGASAIEGPFCLTDGSRQRLPRGERAPERNAERRVRRNDLVADAERAEHAAPLGDDFVDRVLVRGANVGDARRHGQFALRIEE